MTALLTSPLALRSGATLTNRIAKSALSERLADSENLPSERLFRLFDQWAGGGAGMLITGNVMVDSAHLGETGNVALEADTPLAPFRTWSARAKAGGSHVVMQINHPGGQTPRWVDAAPVAPSAVGSNAAPGAFARPRALSSDEVLGLVERFATTASRAVEAGFDGVQIHAAHGYLISQFLSPRTNVRDDAWGGDPERRRAFLLAVVRAVRAAVGPGATVGVKLNSADFQRGGMTQEEAAEVVAALDGEGIDFLEVSGGTYASAAMFQNDTTPDTTREREAYFLDFAREAKRRTSVPVMLTGGFRSRDAMDDALASGAVDITGMGRPLCVEPDLPGRLLSGQAQRAVTVRLRTGIKSLDAMIQGGWYMQQIQRMGAGLPPDPNLSRLVALWRYFRAGETRRSGRPGKSVMAASGA